jgi:hypothetical protein
VNADASQQAVSEVPEAERRLLAGVEPRIARAMLAIGIAGGAGFWAWRGGSWAAGFAIGAVLSGLNFLWMKNAVSVLAEASSSAGQLPGRGFSGTVARFVLRYALIGVAGYAIFRSSAISLEAFFAGLFVAVAAILAEAAYQVFRGFRDS